MDNILSIEEIEQTEAYSSTSNTLRMLFKKRAYRERLTNGLRIAKHIGFEQWKNQSGFSSTDISIIKELLNKE